MKHVKLFESFVNEAKIQKVDGWKVAPVKSMGSWIAVHKSGDILFAPMMNDGSPSMYAMGNGNPEIDWSELTAPESQKDVDKINKIFGTNYKFDDFDGR